MEAVMGQNLSILVVEDEPDTTDSLSFILFLEGHYVRAANHAASALAAAQGQRFDVVVLDLAMPSVNGLELARQLRQVPGLDNGVFVFVTGVQDEEIQRRAKEVGCDDYLLKPVDSAALKHLLTARCNV
jgi:CheY-like chemotaxis protein